MDMVETMAVKGRWTKKECEVRWKESGSRERVGGSRGGWLVIRSTTGKATVVSLWPKENEGCRFEDSSAKG